MTKKAKRGDELRVTDKRCKRCGVGGVKRLYCSNACRSKAHRAAARSTDKRCKRCGVGGVARVYCSDECRIETYRSAALAARREARADWPEPGSPCRSCGAPIVGRRADAVYCSFDCQSRSGRRRSDQAKHERAAARYPAAGSPCRICEAPVVGRRLGAVYCTVKCQKEAIHRRSLQLSRARSAERRAGEPTRLCKYCGEVFELPAFKVGKPAAYCSDQCRVMVARERARRQYAGKQAAKGEA